MVGLGPGVIVGTTRVGRRVGVKVGIGVDVTPGAGVDVAPGAGVDVAPGAGVDVGCVGELPKPNASALLNTR
jgi:hypothetical protein